MNKIMLLICCAGLLMSCGCRTRIPNDKTPDAPEAPGVLGVPAAPDAGTPSASTEAIKAVPLTTQELNVLKTLTQKFSELEPEKQQTALKLLQTSALDVVTNHSEQAALSYCFLLTDDLSHLNNLNINRCLFDVKAGFDRAKDRISNAAIFQPLLTEDSPADISQAIEMSKKIAEIIYPFKDRLVGAILNSPDFTTLKEEIQTKLRVEQENMFQKIGDLDKLKRLGDTGVLLLYELIKN